MKKAVVSLPDGNGCFGNEDFWEQYLTAIGCEYHDRKESLQDLYYRSNQVFPKNTCINSKYRLGRALLLSDRATHFILFLRNDLYVSNCPASVYRIKWIKEYFQSINVIVWKHSLLPEGSDTDNLIELSKKLGANPEDASHFIDSNRIRELPKRNPYYVFLLDRVDKSKKTILLIGVAPHLVDKYRQSFLMDSIASKVNIIDPTVVNSNYLLKPKHNNETLYYKDAAILESIEYLLTNHYIDGIIFISDPFDIPGKFSFPNYQYYLQSKGIHELTIETRINSHT